MSAEIICVDDETRKHTMITMIMNLYFSYFLFGCGFSSDDLFLNGGVECDKQRSIFDLSSLNMLLILRPRTSSVHSTY